jgi:RNA polymerase sigma factor (sigma-70 family)
MLKYQSKFVAELAGQLKRGPIRLRLRQLLGIEFLLSVVETHRSYPADFVAHAITSFRPRPLSDDVDDVALISGETLRSDLVLLAEDLSEDAAINADEWPEPLLSVGDLAKRFDVSTKTIFRWRRRGLVGWKFRCADRRMRLAFPERCVRRFVAENVDLVQRGSTFSQLSQAEREEIISRARALADTGLRTVNAVARAVAAENGRAVETIRLILKNYDASRPRAGIFNRPSLRVAADDQRLAVWEAYVDGESVEQLVRRFNRPVAWVYRTITQMRARELKARKIEFLCSAEFHEPGADAEILGGPLAEAELYVEAYNSRRAPADLPAYLQQLFRIPLLTPRGEFLLFRRMNYLKFKADQLRQGLDPETASASELDAIDGLLEDAARVKNQITQSNLRLVVSIAKRHQSPSVDFFELVSDGNVSLMRAVEKFDFTRGFKFSTYASWAIMRNFARTIPDEKSQAERYQTGREELLETVSGPRQEESENDFLPAVRSLLDRMMGELDEREQKILRQRFGLDDAGESQTLEQIGKRLGVSKERVRQLEARAMTRLRSEFSDEARKLLGV